MIFKFSDLNISQDTLMEKIVSDLSFGVKIKGGLAQEADQDIVIRVWTDNQAWQFSLMGVTVDEQKIELEKIEIQSFGDSKKYIKLMGSYQGNELILSIDKLSFHFAQLATVSMDEAKEFLDGYMQSTINRTLTEQLFNEYSKNQNLTSWLKN